MDLSDPLSQGITDKPTCSIANKKSTSNVDDTEKISISKSITNLNSAHETDSTWIPEILMSIPTQYNDNIATLDVNTDNEIDIVPYTVKPTLQSKIYNETILNYPKDCTLYFQGYDGVQNAEKLKQAIINAASKSGTSLQVGVKDHYSDRGNK